VSWPDEAELQRLLDDASEALARRHGLDARGMAPLLAAQARPYLDVARRVEWGQGGAVEAVIGAEVTGELAIGSGHGSIRWRADRLDRAGSVFAMVDYKTGKPPSDGKRESTRRKHLLQSVALGNTLQGVAYALAAPGGRGEGRYLYLKPEIGDAPEEARHVRIAGDDGEIAAAFTAAVAAVSEAWRSGAMFPRMQEPNGKAGRACDFCSVSEACLVDDSGVRRRLLEWLAAEDGSATPAEAAARRLWLLGFGVGGGKHDEEEEA